MCIRDRSSRRLQHEFTIGNELNIEQAVLSITERLGQDPAFFGTPEQEEADSMLHYLDSVLKQELRHKGERKRGAKLRRMDPATIRARIG
eukprot:5270887-Alexandrium_andersonii.AAC.1